MKGVLTTYRTEHPIRRKLLLARNTATSIEVPEATSLAFANSTLHSTPYCAQAGFVEIGGAETNRDISSTGITGAAIVEEVATFSELRAAA